MTTYYDLLNLSPEATPEEIKDRFRFLANAYHPDKFSGSAHKEQAEAEFKRISQAYEVLSVPAKRKAYDRTLGYSTFPFPEDSSPPPIQFPPLSSIFRALTIALLVYLVLVTTLRLGLGALLIAIILLGGLAFYYLRR